MNASESFLVIHVGQVQGLFAKGHIAGQALRRDRQLEVAAAVQAGLNLRHNGRAIGIDRIQGQPVRIEQLADILAGLQHDLLDVFGVMDARRDLVQLAIKQSLKGHAALLRGQLLRVKKCLLGGARLA